MAAHDPSGTDAVPYTVDGTVPGTFIQRASVTASDTAEYEAALATALDEPTMQRFLEANPGFLVQHLAGGSGAWVVPQARLGSEFVTDFVIAEMDYGRHVWYAVELESPRARMFNKNGDQSAVLTHALRQISDWRIWLSRNLDYATRPQRCSGLGLLDIDPHPQGLIIVGREQDVDAQRTGARRRSLEHDHRVKIRTFDWLADQARERLAAAEQVQEPPTVSAPNGLGDLIGALLTAPRPEDLVGKAIDQAFGGRFTTWARPSAVREIEYDGVSFPFGCDQDDNVEVPISVLRAGSEERLLEPNDWTDWIGYVERDIGASYGLLVSERPPAENIKHTLTPEHEGVWSGIQWASMGATADQEARLSHLFMLVYLPHASNYGDKRGRLTAARETFQRYITQERERAHLHEDRRVERGRQAAQKIAALSLAPGTRVMHDTYGSGTVVSLLGSGAETEAKIDFGAEHGVKHLLLQYAPLNKPQ